MLTTAITCAVVLDETHLNFRSNCQQHSHCLSSGNFSICGIFVYAKRNKPKLNRTEPNQIRGWITSVYLQTMVCWLSVFHSLQKWNSNYSNIEYFFSWKRSELVFWGFRQPPLPLDDWYVIVSISTNQKNHVNHMNIKESASRFLNLNVFLPISVRFSFHWEWNGSLNHKPYFSSEFSV